MAIASGLFTPVMPGGVRRKFSASIGIYRSGFWFSEGVPTKRVLCSSSVEGAQNVSPAQSRVPRLSGRGCKLVGSGSAVPSLQISNDDLAKIIDTSDEWISVRTGIRNRRVLSGKDSLNALSIDAAKNALEMAKVDPSDVDLLLLCTSTPEDLFGSAPQIQRALGCNFHATLEHCCSKTQDQGFRTISQLMRPASVEQNREAIYHYAREGKIVELFSNDECLSLCQSLATNSKEEIRYVVDGTFKNLSNDEYLALRQPVATSSSSHSKEEIRHVVDGNGVIESMGEKHVMMSLLLLLQIFYQTNFSLLGFTLTCEILAKRIKDVGFDWNSGDMQNLGYSCTEEFRCKMMKPSSFTAEGLMLCYSKFMAAIDVLQQGICAWI